MCNNIGYKKNISCVFNAIRNIQQIAMKIVRIFVPLLLGLNISHTFFHTDLDTNFFVLYVCAIYWSNLFYNKHKVGIESY